MFHFEQAAAEANRKYTEEISNLQTMQFQGAQMLAAQGQALAVQAQHSNMQAVQAQQVASGVSASLTNPIPQPRTGPLVLPSSATPPMSLTPPGSYLPPIQPGAPVPTIVNTSYGQLPRSLSRPTGTMIPPPITVTATPTGPLTPRTTMATPFPTVSGPLTPRTMAQPVMIQGAYPTLA
jgi:hypothetical protein